MRKRRAKRTFGQTVDTIIAMAAGILIEAALIWEVCNDPTDTGPDEWNRDRIETTTTRQWRR